MTNESTTSIQNRSGRIILTENEREELLQLGKLRWPEEKIAFFFSWDRTALHAELADKNSEISTILARGELMGQFALEARLMKDAEGGNLSAAKQFQDVMRSRDFQLTKLDLFGGADKEDIFVKIQQYYDSGRQGDLSEKEQLYLDLLQIVYSFETRFGTRNTLKILTAKPYSFKYDRARDILAEAMEMFNAGRRVSREAMRQHIADSYDTLYHVVLDSAKDSKDYALAASILEKKAKILRLDQPDPEQIPISQYVRTYRLLSISPELLGLPAANRDELAGQIAALDVPDATKRRLKMEARVIDTDIIEMLENGIQAEN